MPKTILTSSPMNAQTKNTQPNILFIMTDQQRWDTIAALGNTEIFTPNLDRLVGRGLSFSNAYSPCPVCVAARYTIRTGCTPLRTRFFSNGLAPPAPGQADTVEGRCGPYLAKVMQDLGYRTFGIGKFHTNPWGEDLGYQTFLRSEELYGTPERRAGDDYAAFIARQDPAYNFIEGLMGERTEMYYMPQMSPLPAALTVEAWAAARALEQLGQEEQRPFFGMVSFIGPHPPLAPPIPYNRLYDPDRMPNPVRGQAAIDHMDEQIPWMNRMIWADAINDAHARVLRARYYGEITYIDACLGQILDAVEARGDADNTLICFFADHGDHMGDHNAWQKESFFEGSCHIPFLLSWPAQLAQNSCRHELVGLNDLFAIATGAAGAVDCRDGVDVLGMLQEKRVAREVYYGVYGEPGTPQFKVMVRRGPWKYIYLANGARQQLFNLEEDPHEIDQRLEKEPDVVARLRQLAEQYLTENAGGGGLVAGGLQGFVFKARPANRIYQFDTSRGIRGFPDRPEDILDAKGRPL